MKKTLLLPVMVLCFGITARAAIDSISLPADSQDGSCAPRDQNVWSASAPFYPYNSNIGIGHIISDPGVGWGGFVMHDHQYDAANVPDPAREVVTYHFDQSTVVSQLEVIQHANGVSRIEGFVGDSVDSLVSIGNVFGPSGDITGSGVFSDGTSQVFDFNNAVAGTWFRFVVTKTPLDNGFALYRAYPRDAAGQRIPGSLPGRSISVADIAVQENAGVATFTVTLTPAADEDVTVDYATANGSALAGSDYTTTTGTLTIPAHATTATIEVPIIDDTDPEAAETFSLDLSNPVGADAWIARGHAVCTIAESDVTALTWDAGLTQAGSAVVHQPDTAGGSYVYRVVVPAGADAGMRVRLKVTAGEANLYMAQGWMPQTWTYNYASANVGDDLIVLQPNQYVAGQEWFILVDASVGAEWNLLAGSAAVPLVWDPGTTHEGTEVYQHPDGAPGSYWFRITTEAALSGAWRNALNVTAGEAHLYLSQGWLPSTFSYQYGSARAGSNGFVLRYDQFGATQDWFLLVDVPVSATWSLVTGNAYVQDLGELQYADTNHDGSYNIGETPLESGSGTVTMGAEGVRFFKATVPSGTPAWNLWLGGSGQVIHVRKNNMAFPGYGYSYADRVQAGRMLLVPDYLQASTDTYYIAVADDPGTSLNLHSRIQTVTDIDFNSTHTVRCDGSDAGYRTFRIQVPIQQIAWENSVTDLAGDGNLSLRRDRVPNEFHNDAGSETSGIATDSVTLAPPTLTNGTFYVTIWGTDSYAVSFRNGNPVVTEVPFAGVTVNDTPDKVGWRYYVVNDIESQFGLGWELELTGAPAGTEIDIRRNAVPARWQYRDYDGPLYWTVNNGYVDRSSNSGLMQIVDHQADIWYIGIYNPTEALGSFTLSRHAATATPLAYDGGTLAQTGQPAGAWRWFRVDVPAGPVGWDLWLRDVTAGNPRMMVRRDLLPGELGVNGWWAGNQDAWPSGSPWCPYYDLTGRAYDLGGVDTHLRRLTCGMGRPLEPATYYVGVFNDISSGSAAYTLCSRGIGDGLAIPVADLGFSGGEAAITGLGSRDLAVFKVAVPAGSPLWSLRLLPSAGEMMMAVLRGTVPCAGQSWYDFPWSNTSAGSIIQKNGAEYFSLFPTDNMSELPAGDYYVAVVSEGASPPDNYTAGGGSSSGILRSAGADLTDLGEVGIDTPISRAVTLAGGETRCFSVTVPVGTTTLQVRLDNATGNPLLGVRPGTIAARGDPYWGSNDYGYEGGYISGAKVDYRVLTFANPPAGPFTITVRAHNDNVWPVPGYAAVTATLVVASLPPTPVDFDGGTSTVTGQDTDTWQYFRIEVPAGPVGWDLRLRDVTGGVPRMAVCRDQLPGGIREGTPDGGGGGWSPANQTAWPSGLQLAEATDLTQKSNDPGPVDVSFRHLTLGMGHPLEPGTYFVGVLNTASPGNPTTYTLESRGIGEALAIPVGTVDFTGGSATITDLASRDLAVFKVTVPTGASSWSLDLTPSGGEMMMAVLKGAVASCGGNGYQYPWQANSPGMRVQKTGAEFLTLFPLEPDLELPAGDYYVAVISEGEAPDYYTIGSGTASGIFRSLGACEIDTGTLAVGVPFSQDLTISGGQTRVISGTVAPGTAALEIRLANSTGLPQINARLGTIAGRADNYWGSDDYGYDGGYMAGDRSSPSIITIANPTPGPFTITVRAHNDGAWPMPGFPDVTGTLVVSALATADLDFDGGNQTVNGQISNSWRFFRVVVPEGVFGWDVRLRDVTAGTPQIVVCRDAMPDSIWSGPAYGSGWSPAHQNAWPSGWEVTSVTDLTQRPQDPGGVDARYRHITMGMGHPLEPGTYFIGVLNNQSGGLDAAYTLESRGIGSGLAIPVSEVAFNGGSATVTDLAARDLAVFKVTVPEGASHWSLKLTPSDGEMMMAVEKDAAPTCGGDWYGWPWRADSPGVRAQKPGEEYLNLFATDPATELVPGDYYVAVVSEGAAPPDYLTAGSGTASGTLQSLGTPLSDLGTVAAGVPVTQPIDLAGGETKVFTVNVPPATATLQIRLDDRTGNPQLGVRAGTLAPRADWYWGSDDYGYDGGYMPGSTGDPSVLTFANPPAGPFRITVRAHNDGAWPSPGYPDATATLVVSAIPPTQLNFGSYANSGGGTNQDSRQAISGERILYQVQIPTTVNGLPVLGWKITTTLAQGAVLLRFFNDPVTRIPVVETWSSPALVLPPSFIPGSTWYFEAVASGQTDYTVVSEPILPIPLNFGSYANAGGGTNQDSRQLVNGDIAIYRIDVPQAVAGQPVIGWKVDTAVRQGDVSLMFFRDPVNRYPYCQSSLDTAVIAPPFLTPGTWYCQATASGITDYTITSEPVALQRPAWSMPTAGQLSTTPGLLGSTTFGDTGIDVSGNPLPDDHGVDLGQDDWHFYAVTVPSGNRGVLRTVLEALNGNPDLFLRRGDVPTTTHTSNPPSWWMPLYDYASTGGGTQYGNWVPLSARTETELAPGTWYLGVTAAAGSNCRYRLKLSLGNIQNLATDGIPLTNQSLIGGDWRYYAIQIPANAPDNLNVSFATTQGSVQIHWREILPPGDCTGNPNVGGRTLHNAYDDSLNQGPYQYYGWTTSGTYTIACPPLRPNNTLYLGVKADVDATFSISASASAETIGVIPSIAFYGGTATTTVPAGGQIVYQVPIPPDAVRWRHSSTHSGNVRVRIEEGTLPDPTGPVLFEEPYYNYGWDVVLDNWPMLPGKVCYVMIINDGPTDEPVTFTMDGRNLATDDEDNDGLPDYWERLYFGNTWYYGPLDDPDGDGNNNLAEFADGTDPTNPLSAKYALTLGALHGTATADPAQARYNRGTGVALHADGESGYAFQGWLGGPFRNAHFAVHATATVTIPADGQWTFGTNADDAVRVKIDGQLVISTDGIWSQYESFGNLELTAGPHQIDVVYLHHANNSSLELYAAQGLRYSYDDSFRLVGDTANGGLEATTDPGSGPVNGFSVRQVMSRDAMLWWLFQADQLLAGTIGGSADVTTVCPVLNFLTWDLGDGRFGGNLAFPLFVPMTDSTTTVEMLGDYQITGVFSLPFDQVLDSSGLTWTSGGATPWSGENSTDSSDGIDRARSGPIGDSESSTIRTIVEGPGHLTFDWKVSSQLYGDYLTFRIDGSQQDAISGEVDWQSCAYDLASGRHTLEWTYAKDASVSGGADAAWLDQVSYVPVHYHLTVNAGAGMVTVDPQQEDYPAGQQVTLTAQPPEGLSFVGWSGDATGSANPLTVTIHNDMVLTANYGLALPMALNAPQRVFTTGGNVPWFGETEVSHDGADAAQSGDIGDGNQSWMETTVTGPGTLSFWWKVSSEGNYDWLEFYVIDDLGQHRIGGISGEVDWQLQTLAIEAGTHTLHWRYSKDGSVSRGSDAAWVDELSFVPVRYTLTVNAGGGIVTADPQQDDYAPGQQVALTVSPPAGSTFAGWTGDIISTDNPLTVTMDGDKNLTVNYNAAMTYAVWAASRFSPEELAEPAASGPDANPTADGIGNLLKYAFHLDPHTSYAGDARTLVPDIGIHGLPSITQTTEGVLRVEFIQRVGTSGLSYAVQFGSDLTNDAPVGWAAAAGTPTVTPTGNPNWNRVVIEDIPPPGATTRFARVVVTESP